MAYKAIKSDDIRKPMIMRQFKMNGIYNKITNVREGQQDGIAVFVADCHPKDPNRSVVRNHTIEDDITCWMTSCCPHGVQHLNCDSCFARAAGWDAAKMQAVRNYFVLCRKWDVTRAWANRDLVAQKLGLQTATAR